ncbi:hypothetical protein FKR81_42870, partial [Lentzea tibetensis]
MIVLADYQTTGPEPFTSWHPPELVKTGGYPGVRLEQNRTQDRNPPIRISDDATLAINDGDGYHQEVYAAPEVVANANLELSKIDSGVRMEIDEALTITFVNDGRPVTLGKVRPVFLSGELPSDVCRDFAAVVLGGEPDAFVFSDDTTGVRELAPTNTMDSQEVTGTHHLAEAMADAVDGKPGWGQPGSAWGVAQVARDTRGKGGRGGPLPGLRYGGMQSADPPSEYRRALLDRVDNVAKALGVNRHAKASVGEGYVINSIAASDENGDRLIDWNFAGKGPVESVWGYHFAAVVLESLDGSTQITLENFRHDAQNDAVTMAAVEQNLTKFAGRFTALIQQQTEDLANAEESERPALQAKLRLSKALDELERLSAEPGVDQEELELPRMVAQAAMTTASSLLKPRGLWMFQMYGTEEHSFHDVQSQLNAEVSSQVNPMTLVVLGGRLPRDREIGFTGQSTSVNLVGRNLLRKTAETLARAALWRTANGLSLPTVEVRGDGNGLWQRFKLGRARADVTVAVLKQKLDEQLRRLQPDVEKPITAADFTFKASMATGAFPEVSKRLTPDQADRKRQRATVHFRYDPPNPVKQNSGSTPRHLTTFTTEMPRNSDVAAANHQTNMAQASSMETTPPRTPQPSADNSSMAPPLVSPAVDLSRTATAEVHTTTISIADAAKMKTGQQTSSPLASVGLTTTNTPLGAAANSTPPPSKTSAGSGA